MNSLDILEFVGVLVGALWTLTGCAIWLRWGWCGVRWIWHRRPQIDQAVLEDALNLDNPRCFCPECRADLGSFYSNRIVMVRPPSSPPAATDAATEGSHG